MRWHACIHFFSVACSSWGGGCRGWQREASDFGSLKLSLKAPNGCGRIGTLGTIPAASWASCTLEAEGRSWNWSPTQADALMWLRILQLASSLLGPVPTQTVVCVDQELFLCFLWFMFTESCVLAPDLEQGFIGLVPAFAFFFFKPSI